MKRKYDLLIHLTTMGVFHINYWIICKKKKPISEMLQDQDFKTLQPYNDTDSDAIQKIRGYKTNSDWGKNICTFFRMYC